jgi:2'-5' RNA ligase
VTVRLKQHRLVCYNGHWCQMEQIRSFVAIELSDQLRAELKLVQELLKSKGLTDQVRWVKADGMHLTLKFLGNVPADRVKEISLAMDQAIRGFTPFSITLTGLGCFPSTSRPNVLWIGVEGDTETLAELQASVEASLAPLGYPPEKRKYTPHLTLGRVGRHVGSTDRRRLGSLVQTQSVGPLGGMEVQEISLMKSELSPAGARYSRLAAAQLEER